MAGTTSRRSRFLSAATRFEKAARAMEVIGAQHPGDHAYIELEYEEAKQALLAFKEYL